MDFIRNHPLIFILIVIIVFIGNLRAMYIALKHFKK